MYILLFFAIPTVRFECLKKFSKKLKKGVDKKGLTMYTN